MPTHYEGTPEEVLALNTFIRLTRAHDSFMDRLMSKGTTGSLTLSQFGVLEALLHLGPLCQGELSTRLLKSTGNMTVVVDNLERLGLVRRVRSQEDRRMIAIHLTEAGEERIRSIFPAHAAAITAEMSVLTQAEQAELGRLCKKLGLAERNTSAPFTLETAAG